MHAALIVNDDGTYRDTKPGQVFRFLDEQMGWVEEVGEGFDASPWYSSWQLTTACKTTAIATRVSEIRARLPGGSACCQDERLARYEIHQSYRSGVWYYRLIRRVPQAVMAVEQMAFEEARWSWQERSSMHTGARH